MSDLGLRISRNKERALQLSGGGDGDVAGVRAVAVVEAAAGVKRLARAVFVKVEATSHPRPALLSFSP